MNEPQLPPEPGHSASVVPSQHIRRYVAQWLIDAYREEIKRELSADNSSPKADEMRMDAIHKNRWLIGYNGRIEMWTVQQDRQVVGNIGLGRTVREAVDCAMKEATGHRAVQR